MNQIKCPICKGKMEQIKDSIKEDDISFEAYKCKSCGEELMNMSQLKVLAKKYRDLRQSKEITFSKWGNSLAVRIPLELAHELNISEGTHGLINKEGNSLKITTSIKTH